MISNIGLAITENGLSELYLKSKNSLFDDSYLIACHFDKAAIHFSFKNNHFFIWENIHNYNDNIDEILLNKLCLLDHNNYLFIKLINNEFVIEKGNYYNNDFGFSQKIDYNKFNNLKEDYSSQLDSYEK